MSASTRPLSHRCVMRIELLAALTLAFAPTSPSPGALAAIPPTDGEPIVLASGGTYTHDTWQPTSLTT